MCVQSSAAIMAITLILCSSGVLPIYQGIALVMGENIGTTVTSNLAALSAMALSERCKYRSTMSLSSIRVPPFTHIKTVFTIRLQKRCP